MKKMTNTKTTTTLPVACLLIGSDANLFLSLLLHYTDENDGRKRATDRMPENAKDESNSALV